MPIVYFITLFVLTEPTVRQERLEQNIGLKKGNKETNGVNTNSILIREDLQEVKVNGESHLQ